jgi:hypothetical protein
MPPSRLDRHRHNLTQLVERVDEQDRVIDLLLAQLEELGLRVQFLLEQFSLKQKSPVVGPNGEQASQTISMAQHYERSRESFIAHLKARADHVQGLREAAEREAAADSDSLDGDTLSSLDTVDTGPAPNGARSATAPDADGSVLPFRRGGVTLN